MNATDEIITYLMQNTSALDEETVLIYEVGEYKYVENYE
jgi:hypothetical protein